MSTSSFVRSLGCLLIIGSLALMPSAKDQAFGLQIASLIILVTISFDAIDAYRERTDKLKP